MGRQAKAGYTLRRRRERGNYWIARFTLDGKRHEVHTHERDRPSADRVARQALAEALAGRPTRRAAGKLTPEAGERWLASLPVRDVTRALYRKYLVRWLAYLPALTEAAIASYTRDRLREVQARSLKSELSALRGLLSWLVEVGELAEAPSVPKIDHSRMGTPSPTRHRVAAPSYTEQEIRAVLAALPERAPSGFHVRARFVVLYETGLRPSTVDALRCPDHWSPGSDTLRLTPEVDKEGYTRVLPLTEAAIAALEAAAPARGVIFGEHRYAHFTGAAAAAALPASKAAIFTGQHLRSARATHLLDAGAPLPGVQYLLGHRHTATTSRYVRPSEAAAREALFGGSSGGKARKRLKTA